ncbi:GAF domain-containing protein [Diaminobutyricibacter tongyongensis]|uniref:GAF domain-containing protein n=1 Tax=Leifsonia tongyongensis TaxID=1268043 RepID=A0A6L9XVF1_9MICO|nr:GAF domain-containing sensor histidine kinase [Diaminobutyricibacter tongyongensis]NEN05014.1 GAF domain-containing protein [Diaminobutyricibacter tongyongensis]
MVDDDAITFPDAPRAELDRALADLVDRAREVLQTQGRLRALVKANRSVVSHLELPVVLRSIVEAAVDLVGAEYGALGVLSPSGGLEQFIHVGMTPEQVERIGHLPEGHGLLGALIDDPRPIRLERIADDPRSAGFPPGHPPMDGFLGVPIRVRDAVFGNLYLTNRDRGGFSRDDEQLVGALAATAGFAIDNARLFAETEARRAWSAAGSEISSTLLGGEPDDALFSELVAGVTRLSRAALTCVLTKSSDSSTVVVRTAYGDGASELVGTSRPLSGEILTGAFESSGPRISDGLDGETLGVEAGTGPTLIAPFRVDRDSSSLLLVLRKAGDPAFTPFDLERVADLASQAGIAIELAAARADQQRMLLLEDRTRIARDLHDHVIQQLFATGLELQSIEAATSSNAVAERLDRSVTSIDTAIAQIRTIIFALSRQSAGGTSMRNRILDLADEIAPGLARPATVGFSGPVDLVVIDDLADDVSAVAREGLTNAARHAHAENVSVRLEVEDRTVTLTIQDDGVGLGSSTRRSGLRNGLERATRRGGTMTIEPADPGTRLVWCVPISEWLGQS